MEIPSRKVILLLYEMSAMGYIDFNNQTIFRNQQSFKRVIKRLLKAKLIYTEWKGREIYLITTIGGLIVQRFKEYSMD